MATCILQTKSNMIISKKRMVTKTIYGMSNIGNLQFTMVIKLFCFYKRRNKTWHVIFFANGEIHLQV